MAYSELIRNFDRIRDYLREFYVYGFKSREEYNKKSARTYDNERRRLESWLRDYMKFGRTSDGKNMFISIDSRDCIHNPLYAAWKTKSFTNGDITLHFILLDILSSPDIAFTLKEITDKIDEYLSNFDAYLSNTKKGEAFEETTVRKKLKEYVEEGLIVTEKKGKVIYYRRAKDCMAYDPETMKDVLDYFSEVSPCGVIGSFLLDKLKHNGQLIQQNAQHNGQLNEQHNGQLIQHNAQHNGQQNEKQNAQQNGHFAFKHHYITSAMDSEILAALFEAMSEKRFVTAEMINRKQKKICDKILPLRVMISVQNGRQYLMAFSSHLNMISVYRLDKMVSIKAESVCEQFDELRQRADEMQKHMWGVSMPGFSDKSLEHVEFTIRYDDDEPHIHQRLEREKRCGTVERLDNNTSRFTADVWDSKEMIPWIRTFICRITDIHFSNKEVEKMFKNDIRQMYALYGLEGGDDE